MAKHNDISSSGKLEVITFGESMALMTPTGSKGIEYSDRFEKSMAGAESNVAIGIARLGHRVGWFGQLGKDPLGQAILKRIRGEGVDVSRAALSAEGSTGLIIREIVQGKSSVFYYRRNSAASLMRPEHLDEDYIKQAQILHITGITPALSVSCLDTIRDAISMAKRNGVKICFDPNLRLKLWSIDDARKTLLPIVELCDYFLPGLDELKLLYQTDDFESIINTLSKFDCISVIKGGAGETFVLDKGNLQSVPYFPVDRVVDPVGAGDGFCAGFIVGVLKGYTNTEAVRLGNLIGSIVVQTEGDFEGLPSWEQVDAILSNRMHVER